MTVPTSTVRVNWARKLPLERYLLSLVPVSYWRLNETAGTDAWDRTGGNHGTYTGGVTLAQTSLVPEDTIEDASILLNGSTGYLTVPDATTLDVGDTFSIVAIVKRAATGTKHYICQKGATSPGVYVGTDDKLTLEKVGTADIVKSSTTLNTSAHLVVVTKAGSAVHLYIDGIDVTGTVTNQTCASTASALEWGRSAVPGNYFSGNLDEPAIFARVLTPQEVSILAAGFLFGELGGPYDEIQGATTKKVRTATVRNGRSGVGSAEAIGTASLTCNNVDHFFTGERNLAPNADFAAGLHDVGVAAIASVIAAPTSVAWVADAATGGGTYGLEVMLPATNHAGISEAIEGLFAANAPVTITAYIKSMSGTTSIECGLASEGTPAELAASGSTITGSHAAYSVTFTPTVDISDLRLFVRSRTASAATIRVSRIQVNRGSSANDWLLAPTWPMLQPGALAWFKNTLVTDFPQIAGSIDSLDASFNPGTAILTIQDALQDLNVPVSGKYTQKAHRDIRYNLLDQAIRTIEGAYDNRCVNPEFTTDTSLWVTLDGSPSRNTSVKPSGMTASLLLPGDARVGYGQTNLVPFQGGRWLTISWYAQLQGSADELVATVSNTYPGQGGTTVMQQVRTGTTRRPSPNGASFTRYSMTYQPEADGDPVVVTFAWTSRDAAKGGYISGLMISEGETLHSYTGFGTPVGRRNNWRENHAFMSAEAQPPVEHGWSNMIGNPEFATNTTGWVNTPNGLIGPVTTGANVANGHFGSPTQSTTTASWTPVANRLNLIAVVTSHATNAQTCTLSGNGLTWVSIATIQYSSNARRITLFRALGASPSAGVTTITIAGSSNSDVGWSIWDFTDVDTSGTNGSGAIVQSVTGAATSQNPNLSLALQGGRYWGSFAIIDAVGSLDSMNGSGTWVDTTPFSMSTGDIAVAEWGTAESGQDMGVTFATTAHPYGGIAVEIKPGTSGTVTRLSGGAYGGITSTAGRYTGSAAGVSGMDGVSYPVTGTFLAGVTYQWFVHIDAVSSGGVFDLSVGSSATWTDRSYDVRVTAFTGGTVATQVLWTPVANRTDAVVTIRSVGAMSGKTIDFTGVSIWSGRHSDYGRGFTVPATPSAAASISTVFNSTLGRDVTRVTTQAVAGSGVAWDLLWPEVSGVQTTIAKKLRVTSGTADVYLALGDPYLTAPTQAYRTIALTTSWRTVYLPYLGVADRVSWSTLGTGPSASGALTAWVGTAAASAITFEMADIAYYVGPGTQPYVPGQAAGIDPADTDLATIAIAEEAAASQLTAANVSGARHWISALGARPWWQYNTAARQSLASKPIADTWTALATDITSLQKRRSDTTQVVEVSWTPVASAPIFISAIAVAVGGITTITTAEPHGLIENDVLEIDATGTQSNPTVAGTRAVSGVPSDTTFTLDINVTSAGGGSYLTRTPNAEPIISAASQDIIDRTGTIKTDTLNGLGWITDPDVAQEIADLYIARFGVARERPQIVIIAKDTDTTSAILTTAPDDRVEITQTALLERKKSFSVLARSLTFSEGGLLVQGTFDTETFIPG